MFFIDVVGIQNGIPYKDQQLVDSSNTFSVLIKKRRKTGLGFSVKERSIRPYAQISYVVRGTFRFNLCLSSKRVLISVFKLLSDYFKVLMTNH